MTRREAFEAWAKQPPREWAVERFSPHASWPRQYRDYNVQCAYEAWIEAIRLTRELIQNG